MILNPYTGKPMTAEPNHLLTTIVRRIVIYDDCGNKIAKAEVPKGLHLEVQKNATQFLQWFLLAIREHEEALEAKRPKEEPNVG